MCQLSKDIFTMKNIFTSVLIYLCVLSASACEYDEYRCDTGECIPASQRCDGRTDCVSGSDETGCPPSTETNRYPFNRSRDKTSSEDCSGGFQCVTDHRICLDVYQRCDRRVDCPDGSDEDNCSCRQDEFQCHNGTCLNIAKRCDNVTDCGGGEDEKNCPTYPKYEPSSCGPFEFRCNDGQCVDVRDECDGKNDCYDGTDEAYCTNRQYYEPCPAEDFTCGDRRSCIPLNKRCDGYVDCPDREDETNCTVPETTTPYALKCRSDEFACQSGRVCIPSYQKCDGIFQCLDESDELGCPRPPSNLPTTRPTTLHPNRVSCHWSKFSCHDGLRCVPMGAQCNGSYECGDFSDESNCATNYEGIQLKVYPDDQIIKEGREVVIQCRDEGSTRADVEWIRQDGAPLPHGSRNTRGRLVMPNVSARDSGVYICKALGYYPLTAASQIKAHVTVEKWVEPTTMPRKVCSDYEATCSNGDCIQKSNVCDGNYDCADGSDETRCSNAGCEPNEFRCANRRCIMKTWHCDGDDDCLDGTDEKDCPTNAPGSPCSYTQFQCSNRRQCVPKSFQCDGAVDCDDSSDEVGCSEPHIKTLPPPQVILDIGALFTITCVTVGNPTPLVSWRLNWNHIPTKCKATSDQGVGTLTCPDVQESDQGAYSCEAINSRGVKFATPDTILTVNRPNIPSANQCARGTFSDVNVISQRDCISCFCFGVSTDCYSSNMYTYVVPYPSQTAFRLVNVHLGSSNNQFSVDRDTQSPFQPYLRSMGRNSFKGLTVYFLTKNCEQLYALWCKSKLISDGAEPNVRQEIYPYFAFPDSFHGNQIKSYGGHIRYTVRYTAGDRELRTPDIIIDGNGYTLTYKGPETSSQQNTDFLVNAKLVPGNWYKLRDPRGQNQLLRPASREEIMVVLSNVEDILLKTLYTHGSEGETYITDIKFESARPQNTGQGKAIYVEECRCPAGYTGFSCEDCAPGFIRTPQGPWKGLCRRDDIGCPEGTYGDPSRNIPCQECPCPLTSPRNQFTRKCVLGSDNQPTCECPPGYSGRRCEYCSPGYMGNPLIANDYCRPVTLSCDPEGSESRQPDEYGRCRCKDLTTGLHCNQCKENAFHLAGSNPRGCISCFCMGVSERCSSSNLYRSQITTTFTRDIQDFKLVKSNDKDNSLSLNINPNSREIVFEDFESANQDVYYWSLPSRFLGDKVTSYGGNLTYSVRHVPVPGGQSSKNNAVDVEIVGGDGIHLLFYSQIPVEPNQPVTILAPLFEQFWQSSNGQTGNREQMLRTLSNIQHIFIKATYTTNTKEAGLRFVSLDTAEDRNTGQIRAHEVEQCVCPSGYTGLSCEICNAGYTTVRDGYTGHRCEPCNCNGRASGCDPFNGKCFDCQDFTYGDHCDICRPGYEGDPSRGVPCELQSTSSSCDCNPAGYYRCDENLQCECKVNVEGPRCDRCRPNTFDLSELHPEGCLQCFCSGLNATCRSSNLYVTQIPMQVYQNHGITLTDRIRQQTIDSGFRIDIEKNEIGYDDEASLRGQKLYWSLPQQFTGDRVTSYGGNLTWTQRYTAGNDAINFDDTDVVIFGNGISIYWNNKEQLTQEIKKTFQVQLMERGWRRLSQYGQRDASRSDLLTILSNVEAILIRASHASNTQSVFLSDVSLDTAIPTRTDQRATMVEQCSCPEGYTGYSCETCAKGFYRSYDRSCQRCPCNGNEISCGLAANNSVECKCLEGYTGSRCHSIGTPVTQEPRIPMFPPTPSIVVSVRKEPAIEIIALGDTVRFVCDAHSVNSRPVSVRWSKENSPMPSRGVDDGMGQLIIRGATYYDSGTYICTATDNYDVVVSSATLIVGANSLYPNDDPTFSPVSTKEAPYGSKITLTCNNDLETPVEYTWSKRSNGHTLPMKAFSVENTLTLQELKTSDAGMYVCKVSNKDMTVEIPTILLVTDSVPLFNQKPLSYLALPTFTDAHLHFSIEISFKPTDYNGLILYTGGKSNVKSDKDQGDFISFGLDDGYPVFRFDVGSGPAVVKSNFSVEMNQWHTVTLKRNRRKGMMFVDSQGPYSDESPGAFQGLDLSGLVYIGAVPEFGEIHPDNGFSQGFKGCISRVKYNKTEYELFKSSVERVGVDSCNTCKSNEHNPCINNGLCQDGGTKNGYTCICPPGFSGERCAVLGEPCYPGACGDGSCQDIEGKMQCLCPIGTTGKKCEQKLKILTPAFKHGSYLAYLTPKTRKFKVSIRLNPRDVKDGIILYSGQSDDGLGDFISLSIKDKHMEFRFDTGSGLVVLRSRVALIPHEWVVVTIIKDYKEGKLSVGGEPLIVGSTPGEKLQVLTLRTPLYIGGYNIYHVTPSLNVEVSEGFHGCISTIDVLGYELDLINSAVDSANIMDCSDMESSASCSQKPCQNYGICYPTDLNDRGYNCSCLTGYSGEHCEQEANMCMSEDVCKNGGTCKVTANSYECLCLLGYAPPNCTKRISIGSEIHFLGEGYVELKKELIPERRSEESLSFDFITDDKNALLLWNGQPSYKNGLSREFIAVAIVNGYLEYSYDLGDGMVTIKFSKKRVNDGVKHNVNVTRINKLGSLELDNKIVGKGESPGSQGVITTRGSIYLGGTPNMDLMTGGRYVHPMSGLMMNIRIQDKQITSVGNSASSGYHVMPWIRSQQ
uniref:Basement membrane-specific heparan sulfate proteoglycan core protein n=1 Tax=Cacopsylla melanoneura TaxID=428564 RepID=A0A8D8XN55_9HEMI